MVPSTDIRQLKPTCNSSSKGFDTVGFCRHLHSALHMAPNKHKRIYIIKNKMDINNFLLTVLCISPIFFILPFPEIVQPQVSVNKRLFLLLLFLVSFDCYAQARFNPEFPCLLRKRIYRLPSSPN